MNRKDNMYLEQVMVKIAKFSQNLLKFPKKLQKYEGGQGLFRDNDQKLALEQEVILNSSPGEMTCVH